MSVELIKGQKIDLYNLSPGLKSIAIYLTLNGPANNFSVVALLTRKSGRVEDPKDFLYYNNISNANKSVQLTAENNRQINTYLDKVPSLVQKIVLAAVAKNPRGKIPSLTLQLFNLEKGKEIAHYRAEEVAGETALVIAELYRYNSSWKLSALGSGFAGGFEALRTNYGVAIPNEKQDITDRSKEGLTLLKHLARIDAYIKNRQKNEYEKNQMSLGIVDTSIFGR